jgi:hypothetical protein
MRLICFPGLALLSWSSLALADERRGAPPSTGLDTRANAPAPPSPEARVDPPPKRGWYGGQTLVVEGLSVAAVVASIALDSPLNRPSCERLDGIGNCVEPTPTTASTIADILFYAGAAGYMLGPPIVHIAHDRAGMAGASLGIRFVPPIVLAFGSILCLERFCGYMIPGLASVAAVVALDAGVFAYENVPRGVPMVSMAPWIDVRGRSSGFSLRGTF